MPRIAALFLIQFNVRTGYELVWSSNTLDLTGLDYKLLPSGIHNFNETTVLVSHLNEDKLYYGLGRFRQYTVGGNNLETSRDDIKMYSLGILCEPVKSDWKPNEYINNGWEYIDLLDSKLDEFLKKERYNDFSIFEKLSEDFQKNSISNNININDHLLTRLSDFIHLLGPLVLVVYKQALLRKRILIVNKEVDYFTVSSFTYLIALLSIIPKQSEINSASVWNSVPIYGIGLPDLQLKLTHIDGFIALTNDEIMVSQKGLYDVAIIIGDDVEVRNSDGGQIKATHTDYTNFKTIFKELYGPKSAKQVRGITNHLNISTDDLSLHTTYSISTATNRHPIAISEPSWWLDATESRTWSGSFWHAFSWFATAGAALDHDHEQTEVNEISEQSGKVDLIQLVNIVGSFHKRTTKYIYLINEIIDDQSRGEGFIDLELAYLDMVDMELDPYSEQDLKFIRDFILNYWGDKVTGVSVGMGFACC